MAIGLGPSWMTLSWGRALFVKQPVRKGLHLLLASAFAKASARQAPLRLMPISACALTLQNVFLYPFSPLTTFEKSLTLHGVASSFTFF